MFASYIIPLGLESCYYNLEVISRGFKFESCLSWITLQRLHVIFKWFSETIKFAVEKLR